jgi:hypothetical protein
MTRTFRAGPLRPAPLCAALAGLALALLARPAAAQEVVEGGGGGCSSCGISMSWGGGGGCGCKGPCPPPYIHLFEGPPRIKFKRACPRPVCDPCHLEHYGYYQTCWHPWPYPPDWSHCPCPPPGAALPPPAYPPYTPRTPASRTGEAAPYRKAPETGPEGTPKRKTPATELPPPRLEERPPPRLEERPGPERPGTSMLRPLPLGPVQEVQVRQVGVGDRPNVRLVD